MPSSTSLERFLSDKQTASLTLMAAWACLHVTCASWCKPPFLLEWTSPVVVFPRVAVVVAVKRVFENFVHCGPEVSNESCFGLSICKIHLEFGKGMLHSCPQREPFPMQQWAFDKSSFFQWRRKFLVPRNLHNHRCTPAFRAVFRPARMHMHARAHVTIMTCNNHDVHAHMHALGHCNGPMDGRAHLGVCHHFCIPPLRLAKKWLLSQK